MAKPDYSDLHFETLTVFAGYDPGEHLNSVSTPIYQTSNFRFDCIEDAAAYYNGDREDFSYTRRGNATNQVLEERLALLVGGESCLSTPSGMNAVGTALLSLVKAGDHVVTAKALYGGTDYAMRNNLPELGVEVTFVDTTNLAELEGAIRKNTKVIYLESPSNPTLSLADLPAIAKIAKPRGIQVLIDNTFAPPPMQFPLQLGADIALYSLSKYFNGHGDVIGGAVVGSKEAIDRMRMHVMMRIGGGCPSPFNSFLVLRGLKTLNLRVRQQCSSALKVAEFLEAHPSVEKVYYLGLPSHPQHQLATRMMNNGLYSGMLSFELKEGIRGLSALEAGKQLLNRLKLIFLAVSLGDPNSLISHPASMTHANTPKDIRLKSDITDGLVRLSIGLEHPDDIIADLSQSLDQIC